MMKMNKNQELKIDIYHFISKTMENATRIDAAVALYTRAEVASTKLKELEK